jgi:hypothetical protein
MVILAAKIEQIQDTSLSAALTTDQRSVIECRPSSRHLLLLLVSGQRRQSEAVQQTKHYETAISHCHVTLRTR